MISKNTENFQKTEYSLQCLTFWTCKTMFYVAFIFFHSIDKNMNEYRKSTRYSANEISKYSVYLATIYPQKASTSLFNIYTHSNIFTSRLSSLTFLFLPDNTCNLSFSREKYRVVCFWGKKGKWRIDRRFLNDFTVMKHSLWHY